MGRQSARIVRKGTDHKDIVGGKYKHIQLWHKGQLVWEKLADSDYFAFVVSDTMVAYENASTNTPGTIYLNISHVIGMEHLKIDWGDGKVEVTAGGVKVAHTYPTSDGTLYTVKVYGKIGQYYGWVQHQSSFQSALVEIITPLQSTMYAQSMNDSRLFLSNMFSYCKLLKKIPEKMLEAYSEYNGHIHIDSMFKDCVQLESIPVSLFNGVDPVGYGNVFQGCTSLVSVPSGLFMTERSVGFSYCFQGCISLIYVPQDLFDYCPNIADVTECFSGCTSISTKVPELWEREWSSADQYEYCYRYCVNAINYKDIPSDWR